MKTIIQVLLTIAIIVLGYFCVESINKPVRFKKEYQQRSEKVIERLKDIRSAQVAFKAVNGRYTSSFDTLSTFIANDSLPMVKMEGSLTDSMIAAGMNELMALRKGIIRRDTSRISVMDSLFSQKPWMPDSIGIVPFTNNAKFEMGVGVIETASGVNVMVFEAKVHNNVYLNGLDRQEVININDKQRKMERYPGLKVGSLEEANNNAGNWE
ncbi:hypothetical protein ACT3CD_05680 [Geofilum sp. OHC36d9]|uniref:hypothetical protein n=1 Tax=Geofilum sp. OHC36d9 TaxID=3458413 RepID=UPI00403432FC